MSSFPVYALVLVTAYTNSIDCCGKVDGITASGVKAVAGVTCAADRLPGYDDHVPFGTKIRLLDGSEYIVQDRFGAGHTNRIDLYMNTEDECWEFGAQWRFVEVMKNE